MSYPLFNFDNVDMSNPADLRTTDKLVEENENIPPESVRYSVRNRKKNGLEPACFKHGKYILINVKGYAYWLTYKH